MHDKGGSESSAKLAKADLVPTEYNLRDDYSSYTEVASACAELSCELNARVHSVTKRAPIEALATEREALHRIPDAPYSAAFGESRSVSWSSTVAFRGARYSVPDDLAGHGGVWVRAAAGEVVIVVGEGSGAKEVARHPLLGPGQASIKDEHYRRQESRDPLHRTPRATKPSEAAFLAIGEGAKLYLVEAAGAGVRRIEARMAEAVTLARFHDKAVVDRTLMIAAMVGRFQEGDLGSIIVHGSSRPAGGPPLEHSLSAGTAMWSGFPSADDDTTAQAGLGDEDTEGDTTEDAER